MPACSLPVALMDLEAVMIILASSLGVSVMVGSLAWSITWMVNRIRSHGGKPAVKTAESPQAASAAQALETYKELAKDKLEVIKTALTMGYSDDEIARLDARLERMIGKDKLQQILKGEGAEAVASADLIDTELDREIERLRKLRQQA